MFAVSAATDMELRSRNAQYTWTKNKERNVDMFSFVFHRVQHPVRKQVQGIRVGSYYIGKWFVSSFNQNDTKKFGLKYSTRYKDHEYIIVS
jgi:hypothetical protein